MPNYLWQCQTCEEVKRVQALISDRDIPPSSKEECSHAWERILEMPRVMRESWPDGLRLQNNQDYANLAKSSQLDVDKLDHRPDSAERKDMEKESRALKGENIGVTKR